MAKKEAQPGNLNAIKHGFYSRTFKTGEIMDREAIMTEDMESEINLLRVAMRRV